MTVSIRRMSLGSGYKYLMDSVAKGDGAVAQSSSLTRYYAESGTPPGRFLGTGLAGLDNGRGVLEGSEVTEEMLFNMLGMSADPVTGRALGRTSNKWPKGLTDRITERIAQLDGTLSPADRASATVQIKSEELRRNKTLLRPVAGFDLTFSVPKSISAAWAVADAGTQAVIYEAHQEAIRRTLAYAEQHTFFSRSGTNGVVQEPVRGVIAAGFDHWDSRSGDPQLHTHVVVQNRAQSLDGTWRTLDSRGLFKQVVTLSALHVGVLDDLLTERLGWGFDARTRAHSDAPKFEVTGVSDALIREFSQRSVQIEDATHDLIEQRVKQIGRPLTAVEIARVRQKATLATRPEKHHHSLAEQTEQWRDRAATHVGDTGAWVESLRDRNDLPQLRADDFHDAILRDAATVATGRVAEKRATFTRANVLAEIHRQLHEVRFVTPDDRLAVAERTADLAVTGSVMVTAPELHHIPGRFQRADGTSRFRGVGTELYTTQTLLDAEDRLLTAGRSTAAPVVDRTVVARVADTALPGKRYAMSTDQAVAVDSIATSGRVLDVLVGPAGTGKSTSMAGLRAMWETEHGAGSVLGLAPSAGAAEVLGDELGIATENTAKWLTEADRNGERLRQVDALTQVAVSPQTARERMTVLQRALDDLETQPGAAGEMQRVRGQLYETSGFLSPETRQRRIDALTADVAQWTIQPGQLVIVDEASLAGTFALDALVDQAATAGAKVLLVGDWAQLSAVDAGGAFAMLVRDRDLAPELSDVRRFVNDWEKTASIGLRVGDDEALNAYDEHGRIESGTRDELLDVLYRAWKDDTEQTDCDTGKPLVSLMIAGDRETVAELNACARADRVTSGQVTADGLPIAGDAMAGVGDRVVTRHNNRLLTTGRRWVKNGDAWIVAATNTDGSMTVTREKGTGQVVLPADYVREHVELGYASTAHRCQGITVDTAHAMVSATTAREVLYVAATRGRQSNRLYVDTFYDPDRDTSHGPGTETPARDVLQGVLSNVAADTAAHTTITHEHDTAESIPTLAAEYLTLARQAQAERWDALIDTSGLTPAQAVEVRASDAYSPLIAALRDAEARGLNITTTFPQLVQGRELDTAEDTAATLHGRVDKWVRASAGRRQPASQFIAGIIPAAHNVTDADMARALAERAEAMNARARALAERDLTAQKRWTRQLGAAPADPLRREQWLRELSTIAAYRERWSVTGADPVSASRASIERIGHEKRAEQAAARARLLTAETQRPAEPGTATSAAPVLERGPQL